MPDSCLLDGVPFPTAHLLRLDVVLNKKLGGCLKPQATANLPLFNLLWPFWSYWCPRTLGALRAASMASICPCSHAHASQMIHKILSERSPNSTIMIVFLGPQQQLARGPRFAHPCPWHSKTCAPQAPHRGLLFTPL